LTFHFCPTGGSTVYWGERAFPDSSPLRSATSPTRISRRPPSLFGKSHVTIGSYCRRICRLNVWQSRANETTRRHYFSAALPLRKLGMAG
jgi:hypothetical protein